MRVRFGVGAHRLKLTSTVAGSTIATSEIDMSYTLAVSGYFYETTRIAVGAQLRGDFLVAASISFATLGLTLAGDVITF